jgi:hypothetical protein
MALIDGLVLAFGLKPRLYAWDVWADQIWRVNNLPRRPLSRCQLVAGR